MSGTAPLTRAKTSALVSSASRDARAIRSGAALRQALLALLGERSLDQITIRDICARAGVHYATFFRHYPTREALLNGIARDEIARLNALALGIRGDDNYKAAFLALCVYVDDHRALWSTLLNGGAGGTMREEWVRQSAHTAQMEPAIHSRLPTDLASICAATLIAETFAWWLAQPKSSYSVENVAGILDRLLTGSLFALE